MCTKFFVNDHFFAQLIFEPNQSQTHKLSKMDWTPILHQKIQQKLFYESTEYFKGEPTSPPKSTVFPEFKISPKSKISPESKISAKQKTSLKPKICQEPKPDYQCKICLKKLSSKATLSQHQRYFHLQERYQCEFCRKKFRTLHSVKSHMEKDETCKQSKPKMKSVNFLEKHYFNCDICTQKFVSEWNFLSHKQIVHEKKEVFKCRICTKIFGSEHGLKTHSQRIHDDWMLGWKTRYKINKFNLICSFVLISPVIVFTLGYSTIKILLALCSTFSLKQNISLREYLMICSCCCLGFSHSLSKISLLFESRLTSLLSLMLLLQLTFFLKIKKRTFLSL